LGGEDLTQKALITCPECGEKFMVTAGPSGIFESLSRAFAFCDCGGFRDERRVIYA